MRRVAHSSRPPVRQARHRGSVLVIAMILLVVIGLTALASMRRAVSNQRAVNNLRLEGLAQQFAEMGLRYCEDQMQLSNGSDRATAYLQGLDSATAGTQTVWSQATSWPAPLAPGATSSAAPATGPMAVHVPDDWVSTLAAGSQPFKLKAKPQCLVEKVSVTGGSLYRITARGFSPDYVEDVTTRGTVQGSVVWLQSDIVFSSSATPDAP